MGPSHISSVKHTVEGVANLCYLCLCTQLDSHDIQYPISTNNEIKRESGFSLEYICGSESKKDNCRERLAFKVQEDLCSIINFFGSVVFLYIFLVYPRIINTGKKVMGRSVCY